MNNKAFAKGIAKISLVVFVLALIGFFAVNYILPVFAAHSSTATVTPDIVQALTTYTFTVKISNDPGSVDPISEVRIYLESVPNDFTGWLCKPKTGWGGPFLISGSEGTYCLYVAQDAANQISPGESEDFTFDATTPSTASCRKLHFESRDIKYFWSPLYDDVCVDKDPPVTTKWYEGPQKKLDDGREWISSKTLVHLDAIDQEPHPSGVAKKYYINTLLIENQLACKYPKEYCKPIHGYDADWQVYEKPFSKTPESCHMIEYWSVDKVGNKEQIKAQCVFVDNTSPITSKTIGDPKLTEDIEEVGDGYAEWSTEEAYSGTYSAKLVIPDGATGRDFAGVDSFFDVFIGLDKVSSLSYYRKVTQYDNGWSPIVILGIDADGDGKFEAKPLEWEASWNGASFNPVFLGDDSFIQCEAPTGLSGKDTDFVNVDAYSDFKCYTPNVVGNNYDWSVYNPLSYFQTHTVGRVEPTDKVAMVKVELGGNPTTQDNEIAYVDYVKFNENIIIDEPLWWIGGSTPVYLSCTDPEPHPVDQVKIFWRYFVDGQLKQDWTEYTKPITFPEESMHTLEYYCVDHLGNKEETHSQIYKVDATPPTITKTMIGEDHLAKVGTCPPTSPSDECYVKDDGKNGVHVDVTDGGKVCVVDKVTCEYELWWKSEKIGSGTFGEEGLNIIFTRDSKHILKINCKDKLGNQMPEDVEVFYVDSTPPVTTKTYGTPYYKYEGKDWISSSTPITLKAVDEKVGVNKTYYRYCLKLGCYEEFSCKKMCTCPIETPWIEWDGTPFTIAKDSEHCIQLYSVDKLGNTELIKSQCVYVDNKPPIGSKEVGTPKKDGAGFTWVTQKTPIKLSCKDQDPHPVGQETVWWRISLDGQWGGWQSGPAPKTIYFAEDSLHDLEFYCVDYLGNKEITHPVQYYKVDTVAPVTTKEIIGPQFYNATEKKLYIDGETKIKLTCVDEKDPCAVGKDNIQYRYYWNGAWTKWFVYTGTFNFPEESYHKLEYYCNDTLGNEETHHIEEYYVDKTPPVTTKKYKGPIFTSSEDLEEAGNGNAEWTQEEKYSGSHSAKLYVLDGIKGGWAGVDVEVDIPLKDITELSFWEKVKSFNKNGWDVNVILGIDLDGDGDFEANLPRWHGVGGAMHQAADLHGDTFAEMDGALGPLAAPLDWTKINTLTTPRWWTPNKNGNGLSIDMYDNWSNFKSKIGAGTHDTNIPSLDVKVKLIKLVIGGSGSWMNETAFVDHAKLNGNVIIDEPVHWITSETEVWLSAKDQEPHPSGVKTTYWRDTLLGSDEPCWKWELCQKQKGTGTWNDYTESFKKKEESCHLIEYYSIDNVNKTEQVNKQCVFVDNSAPVPNKEVGEPKAEWDGKDSHFYPEIDKLCWNNQANQIECWKITMFTPISLGCKDPEPHPVNHEKTCFKVELDAEDKTKKYCDLYHGEMKEDGFCCLDHIIENFRFNEETEHNLKYYCVDALGNKGPTDEEKFKVEGTVFNISLYKKWNLVSVPFVLLNDKPDEVFKNVKDKISSVWTYDNSIWYVWTPDDGSGTLNSIKPGFGYWVLTNDDAKVVVGGSLFSPAVTPPDRNLIKGWNLIGYYGSDWQRYGQPDPVDGQICSGDMSFYRGSYCSLISLVNVEQGYPKWGQSIWTYRNCGEHDTRWIEVFTPKTSCPSWGTYGKRMFAGKGYWIDMDEPDIYAPS